MELILTGRNSEENLPLVKSANSATIGSVIIDQIVWKVPHIIVDDGEKLKLKKVCLF